ncbi:MAG: COR domain-containing protein, partial [Cyanobacteria bacterium P01_G01_bin.54]
HSLPLEIEKLSHLTSLNLSNNKLSSLPPEIGKLSNLTSLDLSNNKIRSFPPEIGKLSNLTSLDLSNNKIRSLPPEIGKLSCLNLLKLGSNNLNSLPLEIGQITCLSSLDLNSNHLSSLPPEIGQINNLIWLNLRNNQLSYFPLEIGQLSNLCSLDLSYNHLKELPTSFRTLSHLLPKLEELDLRENPLPIPPEILYKSGRFDFKSILEFYFSQQQADEDNCLYEAKFLIVGEGGAGKTSLMKKIKKPDYELNLEEKSTHGIDVVQWCFELENGQEFRVNIWDFGGQEIYHQTHQFFLTRRSLYALVADTRKENTDFPYWLSSIEIFGSNSPVLIIENEKEDQPCSINKKQLRGDFEYIAGFLPTNLKDGRGLEEIKDAIRYEISKLDHVGMAWPKEWADIRRALEEDTRNTISKQDYFEICAQQGVTDQEKMLRISDFLHQLGICLHFQNDRVLKNILILRPEWATNAVYAVTNNPRVKQALGCFSDADLTQIWSDPQYAHLGDELLQLMEKFKLCYPIPGLSGQYIAPQLLDFNPPDYDWDNQQNLMLRYEYEFMPKGIITQLIVRLYRWIEKQQIVWRSGVVFNNGRARAEVIETYRPYKGEVRIQVVGLHPKELLSIITNEIDEINSSFEKIRVTKKIPCICEECKTDPNPYFFDLATLDRALTKDRQELPCNKSFINVRIRHLTDAVLVPKPVRYFEEQFEQSRFDRLKDQHTEYPPVIVEFVQALTPLLEQLQTESEESSIQTTESAPEILEAEILEEKITAIQTQKPKLIQNLRQKFRNLPQNLRDRDRLLEALREATVTLVTDLADNPALNTLFALLGPLLSDPDEDE